MCVEFLKKKFFFKFAFQLTYSSRDNNDISVQLNSSSRDFNEERRNRLREIEVKAMQYQDELESGRRSIKGGMSIQAQVEHYRKKLIRKVNYSLSDL